MVNNKKWFQTAIAAKPPNTLGNWHKNKPPHTRRASALRSRPANWTLQHKLLSCARALQALANVTRDTTTKKTAQMDANYFYRRYQQQTKKR